MEDACFTSRDSHLNWIPDIPKEQIVKLWRTENLNYGHLNINTCIVGESMRKVTVASLDLHIFTTYFKITEWQCVTPALFQVNACSSFKQTTTVDQGELQLIFEQQCCIPWAKQSVWSWRQTSSQMSSSCWPSHTSSSTVSSGAERFGFHQTPHISSVVAHDSDSHPRKLSPFVFQLGLLLKTCRVVALTNHLWRSQQQFLFGGLRWDISHARREGVSLAVGKMLSEARAMQNATLWALTATTLHSDGESCVSNLGSSRWIV